MREPSALIDGWSLVTPDDETVNWRICCKLPLVLTVASMISKLRSALTRFLSTVSNAGSSETNAMRVPSPLIDGNKLALPVVSVICLIVHTPDTRRAKKISKLPSAFVPTRSRSEKNAIRSPAVLIEGSRLKPPKILPTLSVSWTIEPLLVSWTKISMLPSLLPSATRLLVDQNATRPPLLLNTGWFVIFRCALLGKSVRLRLARQGLAGVTVLCAAAGSHSNAT